MQLGQNHQIQLTVDEPLKQAVTGFNQAIDNKGVIQGAEVALNARLLGQIYQKAVNNSGIIQARTVEQQGGIIRLVAHQTDELALIENLGVLDASGLNGGQITLNGDITHNNGWLLADGVNKGGQIHLLGNNVLLGNASLITATGRYGGGHVRVGGDFWGGGSLRRSQLTLVSQGAVTDVSSIDQGDAGTAAFWSDNRTVFAGTLLGKGGQNGGNGAFTEVSGKQHLTMLGAADLLAPKGQKGTLLLDPTDIDIVDFNPSSLSPVLWIDPRNSSTLTLNGSLVQQISDLSGNNNHLTQGNSSKQPLSASGINGKTSLYFDGGDGLDFPSLSLDKQNSIFIVMQPQDLTAASGTAIIGQNVEATGNYALFQEQNIIYYRPTANFYNFVGVPHTMSNNQNFQIGIVRQGSQVNFSQNGAGLGTTQTLTENNNLTLNSLGKYGNFDSDYQYRGHIGEVVIFDTALNASQKSLLEQQLSVNWGTSFDTPLGNLSTLNQSYLEALSQTSNVSLVATNNITFGALRNNSLDLKGNASLTLNAGGTISMQTNDRIRTEGGHINITGNALSLGILDTTGTAGNKVNGNITLTATGSNAVANRLITAGTGNITVSAPSGTIQVNQVQVGTGTVTPASLLPPAPAIVPANGVSEANHTATSDLTITDLPLIPNFINTNNIVRPALSQVKVENTENNSESIINTDALELSKPGDVKKSNQND